MSRDRTIWDNNHTLQDYHICDSPIIQIRPSNERSNLYVFSEDGYVHHVDGFDFKVLSSIKISSNQLKCVEEILVQDKRGFLVADTNGNLTLFNSSFESGLDMGKRAKAITAIECIGRSRVLISYPVTKDRVRVEMIKSSSGAHIAYLDINGIKRVRDFHCPSVRRNKSDGWVVAASDNAVITISFKVYQLYEKSFVKIRPEFFMDEIGCDVIRQKIVGKNILEKADRSDYFKLSDIEQKKSSISWEYETQVTTESNRLYIKRLDGVNKCIDLGEEEIVLKNMHRPEGRIICGTAFGHILVTDSRILSLRFIADA